MTLNVIYKITTLLVLITMFVFGGFAMGAELLIDGKAKVATVEPNQLATGGQLEKELFQKVNFQLELVNEQNQLLREYKTSLFDTVIWTLSTTIAVLLFIVGGTWFTNFKVFEGEQRRLREELETSQKVMREEFAASLSEMSSNFETRLAASESSIMKMVHQSLESNSVRQARDIDLLRANLQEYIDEIKKQVVVLNEKTELLEGADKVNWKLIHSTESALRLVEEYVWELKGNQYNVLITQIQGLDSAMRAEDLHTVKINLSRMKSTMNGMLDADGEISDRLREMINDSLVKAEKVVPIAASEVITLLKKIRIEQDA